ncbi:MAG: hypothetical protein ACEQSU_15210 [Microgenomates group bacterium]
MAAEVEIQRSLFLAISALGYTTYDSAPQAADGGSTAGWPYVEVGFISPAPFDTANSTGFDAVARIHTRSRSASMLECKTMQGAIYDRLHRGVLAVTGFLTVTIQRELSKCDRMPDKTFHGVCEYRILLDKN